MTLTSAAAGLDGAGFSVPSRVTRHRSMRGLARLAERQTLESLATGVPDAFGRSSCCSACDGARGEFVGDDGALPDGWERRETTWQEALGPLPEGFEVRLDLETSANRTPPWFVETPPKLSVNTVNFFEYELTGSDPVPVKRYGPVDELVADLGALGVQVVRHPGRVQLMLEEVLIEHVVSVGTGDDPAVPYALASAEAMDLAVQASPVLTRILRLVEVLRSQNVELQLIITLITLGSPSRTADVDPFGILEEGASDPTTYDNAIPLSWTEEWLNQVVYDDLVDVDQPFNRSTPAGDTALDPWDARTMDPRNPAKRALYRNFARAIGRWLAYHEAELADVLAGIEICNEVESRQVIDSAGVKTPDGDGWGWLYYYCASALREECDWVPLWLPGIASYAPDATDGALSWDGKVTYLAQLLQAIEGQRIADVVLDSFGVVRPRFERWELVDGLDYHWYHRAQSAKVEPKDPGDRQLLLWLPLELAELRVTLDGLEFTEVELSVTESTINVLCHEDAADRTWTAGYPAGCEEGAIVAKDPAPDYRPTLVACPAGIPDSWEMEAPANAFQGAMVWMRILAALVGGATIAGWHTHQARQLPGDFAATGLRQDLHALDAGIENAGARVSWYALRTMVDLLSTVTAVRLAWPALPANRDEFKRELAAGRWIAESLVWVVELENASHTLLASKWRGGLLSLGLDSRTDLWAYTLFIDGTAGIKDPVTVPACATVSLRADLGTDVYRVALEPDSLVSGTASTDSFPSEVWTPGPVEHVERSGRYSGLSDRYNVKVGLGQWPVLLLSTASLEVVEVTVGGTLA